MVQQFLPGKKCCGPVGSLSVTWLAYANQGAIQAFSLSLPLTVRYNHDYALKMKTAISIPDKIFNSAEALAQRLRVSRSELYTKAVEGYLKRNKNQGVTEILNDIYREDSNSLDDGLYSIQTQSIDKEGW